MVNLALLRYAGVQEILRRPNEEGGGPNIEVTSEAWPRETERSQDVF